MLTITHSGKLSKTERFLQNARHINYKPILEHYAKIGLEALANATPVDSGVTADSWSYKVAVERGRYSIVWTNSKTVDGDPLVILLQYGHATRNGGYVQGNDFINPTLKPIFDQISKAVWKEVTRL